MKTADQLEKAILDLPPAQRAQLALAAWESLASDPAFAADRQLDPEGIAVARERDEELSSGRTTPLTDKEFRKRTSGNRG